jgi:hypothetical protein
VVIYIEGLEAYPQVGASVDGERRADVPRRRCCAWKFPFRRECEEDFASGTVASVLDHVRAKLGHAPMRSTPRGVAANAGQGE